MSRSNIFTILIQQLNTDDIRYCLLRTGSADPFSEDELDILVHPADKEKINRAILSSGFVLWKERSILKKRVYAYFNDDKLFLADVHFALIQNGLEYLAIEGVFENRVKENGLFVLAKEDQFLHYFFHNFLGKSHFQTKHIPAIEKLLAANLNWQVIDQKINDPKIKKIIDTFAQSPQPYSEKNNQTKEISDQLKSHYLKKFGANRFRQWYQRKVINRFGRNKGVHFAFMGVDGAGKSSLTDNLDKILTEMKGVKHKVVYMGPWGHSLSPWHKWVLRKQISLPSEQETGSKLKKHLKGLIYYTSIYLELWYRYYKKVRPIIKKGQIVLSDRYIYDLRHIYKKRAVSGFRFVRYIICRFFPVPDNVVFLYNEPQVIVERKPQLDAESIKMFQDYYTETLKAYPHQKILTDRPPEVLAAETLKNIMSQLLTNHKN